MSSLPEWMLPQGNSEAWKSMSRARRRVRTGAALSAVPRQLRKDPLEGVFR